MSVVFFSKVGWFTGVVCVNTRPSPEISRHSSMASPSFAGTAPAVTQYSNLPAPLTLPGAQPKISPEIVQPWSLTKLALKGSAEQNSRFTAPKAWLSIKSCCAQLVKVAS